MLKENIHKFVKKSGYTLCRHQVFDRQDYGKICVPPEDYKFDIDLATQIINFYSKVPPFYDDSVLEPLKIEGAWKRNLLCGRQTQLLAISNNDIMKYQSLLNRMFRNEMISAMWDVSYLNNDLINKKLPPQFLEWMDGYKYLTGRSEEDLVYTIGGSSWGCKTDKGIVKVIDPSQGIKAQNIINLLNLFDSRNSERLTVCDLGSGFGGDMEKVARWYDKPLRIIFVDIPLNLTSAYAYISLGFKECDKYLIESKKQLSKVLSNKSGKLEFIFVPTIFVEGLANEKIHVLHNHGSFSEMDSPTIAYYLNILVNESTGYLVEINSNRPTVISHNHVEIPSNTFPVTDTHSLFMRTPTWITSKGHRYLNSVYANKKFTQSL